MLLTEAYELNSMLNQVLGVVVLADLGRWWVSPSGQLHEVGSDHCEWVIENPAEWESEPYAGKVKNKVEEYRNWRDYSSCGDVTRLMVQNGWIRVFDDAISAPEGGAQQVKAFLNEMLDHGTVRIQDIVNVALGKSSFEGPIGRFLKQ